MAPAGLGHPSQLRGCVFGLHMRASLGEAAFSYALVMASEVPGAYVPRVMALSTGAVGQQSSFGDEDN